MRYCGSSTVQTLTYNVLKLFMEMDSQLFDQCSAQLEEREGRYVAVELMGREAKVP
jgi:hypothetical protein